MPITQSEVDKIIYEFHEKFIHAFDKKDIETIVNMYDKHGVIVHRGNGATYGHEKIREFYQDCFNANPPPYKIVPKANVFTPNGEYLIQDAFVQLLESEDKVELTPTVFVFKRMDDGSYKIYRDEIECEGHE